MLRLLVAGFLIAHGLIHWAVYAMPKKPDQPSPFDPGHSWMLAAVGVAEHPAHTLSVALALVTTAGFCLASGILLAGGGWWLVVAAVAAITGLVLKLGYFNPWLSLGVLLDAGVLVAAAASWPPSLT
jgi:hypothetical protein